MKQKAGNIIRILSILLFIIFATLSFADSEFMIGFLIFSFIVLILLNISQILNPLNVKRNLSTYFGMFIYFMFIYLWANNYAFQKYFNYHGVKLYYKHSVFNGSYQKIFRKSYYTINNLTNEAKKQNAINIFWLINCENYEREKSYTDKQKADLKTGKIKVYTQYDYTKGNLKDLILNEFTKNKIYIEKYNYITKQKTINIDTILKYKVRIFDIQMEE